jgi:hypothetical protein
VNWALSSRTYRHVSVIGETSTHQRTIHWMPVITQLWMNVNWS